MPKSSHILKHYLDNHIEDGPEDMIFRIKVLCFYERQVHESVMIQQNRRHNLLNSKSEFPRCSVPKLRLEMDGWSDQAPKVSEECVKEST